jgi:hypothetical protein
MELVTLFNCEFRSGRAESAPTLRKDQGNKTTMADYHNDDLPEEGEVNEVNGEIAQGETEEDQQDLLMILPHLVMTTEELNAAYPSLQAPEDFDQHNVEPVEPTLEVGMREAASIASAMRRFGRTKRDLSNATGLGIPSGKTC